MTVSLFQTHPKPDLSIVDRVARSEAAMLLRRFASGQLTNDQFDNNMPVTPDPAIAAIWDTAWAYYSDFKEHRLTGQDRLHPDTKRAWIRWIMFLDTELKYLWPAISQPGNDPVAQRESAVAAWLRAVFVREDKSSNAGIFESTGHYPVWPFISQKDYREALRNPRRPGKKNAA